VGSRAGDPSGSAFERELRDMNEALLISSVRQHELTEEAQRSERALRKTEAELRLRAEDLARFNLELRASEERYRTLFDSIDEGFCVVEMLFDAAGHAVDYRFLETNPGFEKQTGLRDVTGKRVRELMPTLEAHWVERFGGVALTGESARFVDEAQALGGRSFDVYAFRLGAPERRIVAVLFKDITERKRAAQALQDSEVRYRRIFECAQDGILILDVDTGAITEANPFMAHMLGYPIVELVGRQLWQIGLMRDASASQSMVRELRSKGFAGYENLPLRNKDGGQIEVEVVATLYQEDRNAVIQCNIHDITERRRLEEKTQEQARSLADLNRRKDEFLAMLSHELRNPLASILNASHLLRRQQGRNPIQVDAQAMIDRQVSQLARLVDDLLEVSRISTGRIRLRRESLDLRGIVHRAVETTQPQVEQKGQRLVESLPGKPVWVRGDAVRLEQVVVNLLNNASKYTDRSGQIEVMLQQECDEAVLRVHDNGVGIAPEILPLIFDLFMQADQSLDRAQGGLGIGLALVQSLVTLHRGRVEAHSTPGRGSEFVVRLPMLMSPQESAVARVEEGPQPARSLRVLVVDDNVDAAQSLAMLLQMSGHDARVAHDGTSAMQVVREFIPDAVLLDIGLPFADGYEVAKLIRAEPALGNALLLAVTGYGRDSDLQRTLEAGFDHHLVKPVDYAQVERILSTATPVRSPT
jgi:PAS domain S-box-containing protein